MERTLDALAQYLKGRVIGDGTVLIRGLNNLDAVGEGELTFAEDAQRLAQAMTTKAWGILVASGVTQLQGRSGISVSNPKLAFALLLELFNPAALSDGSVHPTAVLGEGVQLGERVTVRAHAVIGDRARIGAGSIIEPGVCIGPDVVIGERCLIGPNVTVYRQTLIGNQVCIHAGSVIGGDGFGYVFHEGRYVKIPQVGNVVIEDDVEIGCNSCVDRATLGSTLIQRGTKIDNLVQVAHNNRIGRHVVLAGQVGLAGSVTIGDYSLLGGQAGVIDHVTLTDQTRVGAASLVTKSFPPKTVLWGTPARELQRVKQQMAALGRLPGLLRMAADLLRRLTGAEDRLRRVEDASGASKPR
ncbi:MAG: UDP-3-O-(3-hydroxymyristoyl)glucosamine N-acyltransferase [Candidatus Omnitrophica bacterium]|nr:UDP-3-O-(3-hydroxymyristoyl)glucosamine N-acyltransferase [Candidatus Omnitrophota bacterium]